MKLLIIVAMIQSALACLAFVFPSIKEAFLSFMIKMGGMGTENGGLLEYRTFGFANSLLDQFGYGTGLLAGVSFYLGVNYKRKYIVCSLIIIIASLLNARSGILIYVIGIMLTGIFSVLINRSLKDIFRTIIFIVLVPTIFASVLEVVSVYNDTTGQWLNNGVDSVIEFIETGSSDQDNMKIISSDRFWELPGDERIIIGTGHSRYGAEGYQHTDNGWVNDIWFVGVLGLLLLYGIVVYLCLQILRHANNAFEQYIALFFLSSFFIFDIKAASIGYNMGGAVFFLIVFSIRLYQNMRDATDKESVNLLEGK